MPKSLPPFDRYRHYLDSVQSPKEDMEFIEQVFRETRGSSAKARVLREDFCGTFANCCEWVKLSPDYVAHGVDLDPEPIAYGREHHLSALTADQAKRVEIIQGNVLAPDLPHADVICAMNFSFYSFKQRSLLVSYFKNCLATLNDGGLLLLDCFGGRACQYPAEERSTFGDPEFAYYWDQESFDPVTNEATFKIHFKRAGEKKRLDVFAYDWRMWTIPELREALLDAGFSQALVYWEGTAADGTGDGHFRVVEHGEPCDGWVAYLAALK